LSHTGKVYEAFLCNGDGMKNEMRAFDILAMVDECQVLVGGFIDKVFQWDGNNILVRVNLREEGKAEIFLREGKWFYLSPRRPEIPDFPEPFAVNMRKNLSNARITAVRQVDFDRILIIDLQRGEDYQLIFELFGEGNLLLVKEGRIVNCLSSRRWRHREVRPGAKYELPPSRFNPLKGELFSFTERMASSHSDLVRTLATVINLGGQYGEEICLRTGLDKSVYATSLSSDEIETLFKSLNELIGEIHSAPRPRVVFNGDEPMDVTPIPLHQYEGLRAEELPSFSEALHLFLEHREGRPIEDAGMQKLIRQLERQRASVAERDREAEELVRMAEALYLHYEEISRLLADIQQRAREVGWEELRKHADTFGMIKGLDPSRHEVTAIIDGEEVTLDYGLNLDANANLLYQRSKELREKAKGAEEALRETEAMIEKRRKGAERKEALDKMTPTKQFWFERYKWFITVNSRLVMAGRDAKTNDQLVKKHLKPEDRYAHADVHGAPSVVVKTGSEAVEEELREACVFALCHSKAWNAGVREGSAYWVHPDQVSKQPQAGEFVPRGGFIIRGKRNYFHHLPLEMGVGQFQHEGERKIMCAPRKTIESACDRYVIIAPGKEGRSFLSSQLAKVFGVPEEEVSRILPPGDIEIVTSHDIELVK